MEHEKKYSWIFPVVALAVIVLDQATKTIVLKTMPLYESIPIISGCFSLTHVHNPGGAFGFLAAHGAAWRHWLFLGAALFALGFIVYFYRQIKEPYPFLRAALGLILGGAAGNLIDRLRFGEVVDFLDFYVGQIHWPTFNIADSAVTTGVIIFVIHIVFKKVPL
jgi:signal peptidase II